MPALPDDIAAAIRETATAEWLDPTIRDRYPSARDAKTTPSVGYFDSVADAELAITARGLLLGTERQRFSIVVEGMLWIDPAAGIPVIRVIDAEQAIDAACILCRIEVSLEDENTTLEVFG